MENQKHERYMELTFMESRVFQKLENENMEKWKNALKKNEGENDGKWAKHVFEIRFFFVVEIRFLDRYPRQPHHPLPTQNRKIKGGGDKYYWSVSSLRTSSGHSPIFAIEQAASLLTSSSREGR